MSSIAKRKLKIPLSLFRRTKIVIKRDSAKEEKQKRRKRRLLTIELAKSGRSKCKHCRECITFGSYRVGMITFIPHRNVKWFHLNKVCVRNLTWSLILDRSIGWDVLPSETRELALECWANVALKAPHLPEISGPLDMNRMASAMTSRYDRFRSFKFGLDDTQQYSDNWNWRCLLSTMLVCNSREETMLHVVSKLFKAFPNQDSLLGLYKEPEKREEWTSFMDGEKLKHARTKMSRILFATKLIKERHGGKVPKDRKKLRKIPGVGAHVSSVTRAWVHQAPEFGIDVHVRRIMERMGYIQEGTPEKEIELKVKYEVKADRLGHFSRTFVDHGQSVCGYVPDCANCYLSKACPSSSKYLDW